MDSRRNVEGETDGQNLERMMKNTVGNVALECYKTELYSKKKRTIEEWKHNDKRKDELLETTEWSFGNVKCFECGSVMNFDFKDLELGFGSEIDRVMFIFSCNTKGHKKRVLYDNGEEYKPDDYLCKKCSYVVDPIYERSKNVITTTYICGRCDLKEVEKLELGKKDMDPHFEEDRTIYCLSDEVGDASVLGAERLKHLTDKWKEEEENKEVYEKVSTIEKVTILELEKRIADAVEKNGFVRFHFKDPERSPNVEMYVPFIVYDEKKDRTELESSYQLKQRLKAILKDTNWRLMSDGVMYRVGMLEGRLRVYSTEQELMKLVS